MVTLPKGLASSLGAPVPIPIYVLVGAGAFALQLFRGITKPKVPKRDKDAKQVS